MYSKSKGITDRDYTLTPPPGYDGSRFRRRSDGRDDSFPLYGERQRTKHTQKCERPKENFSPPCCDHPQIADCEEDCSLSDTICNEDSPVCCDTSEKECSSDRSVLSFLNELGQEEILLVALIVLLCSNQSKVGMETVLILALLLCLS